MITIAPSPAQDTELSVQFGDGTYTEGNVDGQQGWRVVSGTANVQGPSLNLHLPPADPASVAAWLIPETFLTAEVFYVRLGWNVLAETSEGSAWSLDVAGARVLFRREGEVAYWYAVAEDGALVPGYRFSTRLEEGTNRPVLGSTLTFRFQRVAERWVWDLTTSDGSQYILVDRPLLQNSPFLLRELAVRGVAEGLDDVVLGSLTLSLTNSLFDRNGNGLYDTSESYWGTFDDLQRYDDLDGDGLLTIQELFLKTNPRHPDSDGDGIDDGEEVAQGSNPLAGRWPNAAPHASPTPLSDRVISDAIVLDTPFIVTGRTSVEDRIALLDMVESVASGEVAFLEAATRFLDDYPESPFALWVGASAGLRAIWQARYLAAEDLLERLTATHPPVAVPLARLYTLRGNVDSAAELLSQIRRDQLSHPLLPLYDDAIAAIDTARGETPWKGWSGYRAVAYLARALHGQLFDDRALRSDPPQKGNAMLDLRDWAHGHGVDLVLAHREPRSVLLSPSVFLWKHGHYGCLLDPTGLVIWSPVSDARIGVPVPVLDDEMSGYFLIPAGTDLPAGWRLVADEEALEVEGERFIRQQGDPRPRPEVTMQFAPMVGAPRGSLELRISGSPGKYRLSRSTSLQLHSWVFLNEVLIEATETVVIPAGRGTGGWSYFYRLESE